MNALTDPASILAERYSAHNYNPLPVVIVEGEGAWVRDINARRYLDMLSAYSAMNFGHRHPKLIAAARAQLDRVTVTSRAFGNDQLGPFCRDLAQLCGMDLVLPMNTGAEGVETAIKVARRWGYEHKGIPENQAEIIVCDRNFHGRTTTIISFSTDENSRRDFGPFTPGFVTIPFDNPVALEDAITDNTAAFLVEPVQGEAGVYVPQEGYLQKVRDICSRNNVLMIADEIQTGLGRTGRTFACEHENVKPDMYILGKALGGGIVALSAVVSSEEILGVIKPGDHGSTFGGNPLACAIGRAVIALLETSEYQNRAARLGEVFLSALRDIRSPFIAEVRGLGLWAGVELTKDAGPARAVCEELLEHEILAKDTHFSTLRLAPPLVILDEELEFGIGRISGVLEKLGSKSK